MLFNSTDVAVWDSALALYPEAFKALAATKTDQSIIDLDKWYQTEFPTILASRSPCFINHDEIVKLVAWKLKVRYYDKKKKVFWKYRERKRVSVYRLDLVATNLHPQPLTRTLFWTHNKWVTSKRKSHPSFCSHSFFFLSLQSLSHTARYFTDPFVFACCLFLNHPPNKNKNSAESIVRH